MKVVVTGAGGQLATELALTRPEHIELCCVGRAELDIGDADAVRAFLEAQMPDVVINAAAYTAVDKAEEDCDQAFRVNEQGTANLVNAMPAGAYLLHVSTDFVFNGAKNVPYAEDDETHPMSVYGESKRAGERVLEQSSHNNWAIVRTSWVYAARGKNFVHAMLHYMSQRESMNIVVDQVGTPTWAKGLAQLCWQMVDQRVTGLYHWSDAGVASWYDFAEAIMQLGLEHGLLERAIPLYAIPTASYPLPARRPAYSVMDKRKVLSALPGLEQRHWQTQLRAMFNELKEITN